MRVSISTARKRLFQLTDLVRQSGNDTVVVLEQRGRGEPVALVREAHLAYLEERVMQLEKKPRSPFVLAGSLASDLDEGALRQSLRELRAAWASSSPSEDETPPRARRARARR
jgi:hypothetical protein